MPPAIIPLSCSGEKPLGHDDQQIDVHADRDQKDGQCQSARVPAPRPACARRCQASTRTPFRSPCRGGCGPPGFSCFRSLEHIIGVAVSETSSETRIATESVTANSRNNRPTMPPISRIGMNTAISDRLIESTVKPISLRSPQRRLHRRHALLEIARDVFDHHDRVVHHEARRNRQRHQRKIVDAVAEQIHHAERPDQRNRHRHARDQRGVHVSQKDKHHQNHERDRNRQRALRRRVPKLGWWSSGRRPSSGRFPPESTLSAKAAPV